MNPIDKYSGKPIKPLAFPLNIGPASAPPSPVTEDFEALIEKEVGPIPLLSLTVEVFVDRVNQTYGLRYYFQEPSEQELAAVGLLRQGYWLRARQGSEHLIVSIPKIAAVLHNARLRVLRRR